MDRPSHQVIPLSAIHHAMYWWRGNNPISARCRGPTRITPLPILFLFYNASLIEAVRRPDLSVTSFGFADDIKILAYGPRTTANCTHLAIAHEICLAWAETHGKKFAVAKYGLTYFTRRRGFDVECDIQRYRHCTSASASHTGGLFRLQASLESLFSYGSEMRLRQNLSILPLDDSWYA